MKWMPRKGGGGRKGKKNLLAEEVFQCVKFSWGIPNSPVTTASSFLFNGAPSFTFPFSSNP